jgi:hypothetical protein
MKKNLIISTLLLMGLLVVVPIVGQDAGAIKKELTSRSIKKARQEAKKLAKEGFYVAPAGIPMEMQLEKSWMKALETDDNGNPRYLAGNATSYAETQIAAKLQATEAAKLDIAGQIATEVAQLVETNIANQQLSTSEAASVTKTVAAAKSLIAQNLGRVIPTFEAYKKVGTGVEVQVRIFYDQRSAQEDARKLIRDKLEKETGLAQEKLDALLKK